MSDPTKAMTWQEWHSLAVLALNAATDARHDSNEQVFAYLRDLADKCEARSIALKEGRVMP